MSEIMVLKGLRYTPEMFLDRMNRSKKLENITCRHINTIYSLCWIFQFRVAIQVSKKTTRYAGYYAGYDESVLSPGKIAVLPSAEPLETDDVCILHDKLTEEEALDQAWEYNKKGIIRKYKSIYAPPVLEDHRTDRFYKPLYVFEFHNLSLDEKKYKVLDSLTGDLDDIRIL
jgi:hypothetical protein